MRERRGTKKGATTWGERASERSARHKSARQKGNEKRYNEEKVKETARKAAVSIGIARKAIESEAGIEEERGKKREEETPNDKGGWGGQLWKIKGGEDGKRPARRKVIIGTRLRES